ncbi:hypothetical protein HY311_03905 [Candidatus Nomurabacteria bacterium]|nr:hypothetical protein [Candidatus Nomurabacteria bacterium]
MPGIESQNSSPKKVLSPEEEFPLTHSEREKNILRNRIRMKGYKNLSEEESMQWYLDTEESKNDNSPHHGN